MNLPPRPPIGMRQSGREPAARSPRRSAGGCAAVAALVAISGCGSTAAPAILNTERIEVAIEQGTMAQRHKRIDVSCPSGVLQKKGVVFTCTAVYHGGRGQFVVTELDGAGRVHYAAQ